MEDFDSKFRRVAENIADAIRCAAGVQGRGDISVIVEDKGAIEQLVAEALGSTGLCVIVGVTGFSRRAQSGPVITGTLDMEFRVVEIPSVNRTEQGFVTAQQMAEWLAMNLHWRTWEGMDGRPLLFGGFQRDDSDEFNICRVNFSGECSLGTVKKEN